MSTYILRKGVSRTSDLINDSGPVAPLFVDTFFGAVGNNGSSWDRAFKTMAAALSAVETGGKIYFRGDVREEIVGSNLKFDVHIIGAGSLHHPDLPAATGYHPGSSTWRAPASPTTATALLEIRGRGWKLENVFFDCPVDAAAVLLKRNALSDVSEFDSSHASFINCRFVSGKYGIEDSGGAYNVTIVGCQFAAMTTAAIANTSTAVALPLNWHISDCEFPSNVSDFGNVTHIDAPFSCAVLRDNVFGIVRSTAKYIDLTGGGGNVLTFNTLAGEYELSNYVAGTADVWYQNACAVDASTAPDGVSLLVPD